MQTDNQNEQKEDLNQIALQVQSIPPDPEKNPPTKFYQSNEVVKYQQGIQQGFQVPVQQFPLYSQQPGVINQNPNAQYDPHSQFYQNQQQGVIYNNNPYGDQQMLFSQENRIYLQCREIQCMEQKGDIQNKDFPQVLQNKITVEQWAKLMSDQEKIKMPLSPCGIIILIIVIIILTFAVTSSIPVQYSGIGTLLFFLMIFFSCYLGSKNRRILAERQFQWMIQANKVLEPLTIVLYREIRGYGKHAHPKDIFIITTDQNDNQLLKQQAEAQCTAISNLPCSCGKFAYHATVN